MCAASYFVVSFFLISNNNTTCFVPPPNQTFAHRLHCPRVFGWRGGQSLHRLNQGLHYLPASRQDSCDTRITTTAGSLYRCHLGEISNRHSGALRLWTTGLLFAITLIDYFSKWPEIAFISQVISTTVIKFLSTVFRREGNPQELISDNGSQFTSQEFETFLFDRHYPQEVSSVRPASEWGNWVIQ